MNPTSTADFVIGFLAAKDVTQQEIAEELGVTRQTVSAKLRRLDNSNIHAVVEIAFGAGVHHGKRQRGRRAAQ